MDRVVLPLCVLCLLWQITEARADESLSVERVPAAHTFLVAADLGTTNDVLGRGFDRTLSPGDRVRRVYPATYKEVPVKQYQAHFEAIENGLQLEANARYLFVHAGVKKQANRRYMVFRASYIDKVVVLEAEVDPLEESDLYASKVLYGWALYIIIEGDASSFSRSIAAALPIMDGALENRIRTHRLSHRIHTIGLEPKEAGAVVFATTREEIQAAFKTPESPVPILVEYTTRRPLDIETLSWKDARLAPGQYIIDVEVEVASSKADGRPWDALGDPPDPLVKLHVDQTEAFSCKQQDSLVHTCLSDKVVTLGSESVVWLEVVDKDMSADDVIGTAGPVKPIGSAELNSPLVLDTHRQVQRASITFRPRQ